jgi:hypothetical protein
MREENLYCICAVYNFRDANLAHITISSQFYENREFLQRIQRKKRTSMIISR